MFYTVGFGNKIFLFFFFHPQEVKKKKKIQIIKLPVREYSRRIVKTSPPFYWVKLDVWNCSPKEI